VTAAIPRAPVSAGRRWLRRVLAVGVVAALSWLGGLFWFVAQVPHESPPPEERTDAIVVLTGGSERLETGLKLLAEGYAGKLFVSGVARGVDVAQLLRVARRRPDDLACCIAVGYAADNTAGNARETAEWMRAEGYSSLRLVTASYHMPRSLIEFRRAMPDVEIVPHAVFPPQFKCDNWWLWPGSAALLASEFNKYIVARLRSAEAPRGEAATTTATPSRP
jgi:uncharacterized SAM-binding protein YcdF (DUF218 family)